MMLPAGRHDVVLRNESSGTSRGAGRRRRRQRGDDRGGAARSVAQRQRPAVGGRVIDGARSARRRSATSWSRSAPTRSRSGIRSLANAQTVVVTAKGVNRVAVDFTK